LRACALQDQSGWDKRLPYAESLLQQTSVHAVLLASTQAVPGTACGAPPVM
jgi:hypothetical protein